MERGTIFGVPVQHTTIVCPHGKQISTCRCPSPNKITVEVAECPFDCKEN